MAFYLQCVAELVAELVRLKGRRADLCQVLEARRLELIDRMRRRAALERKKIETEHK